MGAGGGAPPTPRSVDTGQDYGGPVTVSVDQPPKTSALLAAASDCIRAHVLVHGHRVELWRDRLRHTQSWME
jgi:hypothetical protein